MTELTVEQLALVRQYLAKQASNRAEVEQLTRARYYHIEFQGFDTIVPSSECEEANAVDYAMSERLQAWYRVPTPERDYNASELPVLTVYTHDQYCDWLRKKEIT
jgi:hypothetical protein